MSGQVCGGGMAARAHQPPNVRSLAKELGSGHPPPSGHDRSPVGAASHAGPCRADNLLSGRNSAAYGSSSRCKQSARGLPSNSPGAGDMDTHTPALLYYHFPTLLDSAREDSADQGTERFQGSALTTVSYRASMRPTPEAAVQLHLPPVSPATADAWGDRRTMVKAGTARDRHSSVESHGVPATTTRSPMRIVPALGMPAAVSAMAPPAARGILGRP